MKAKAKALEGKMHKVHQSKDCCRHCGKVISRTTRHESGHREYDHEKEKDINSSKPIMG